MTLIVVKFRLRVDRNLTIQIAPPLIKAARGVTLVTLLPEEGR